jgi:hypothetical protein
MELEEDRGGPGGSPDTGAPDDAPLEVTVIGDKLTKIVKAGFSAALAALAVSVAYASGGSSIMWGVFGSINSPASQHTLRANTFIHFATAELIANEAYQVWSDPPRFDYMDYSTPQNPYYRTAARSPAYFEGQRLIEELLRLTPEWIVHNERAEGARLDGNVEAYAIHDTHRQQRFQRIWGLITLLNPPSPRETLALLERRLPEATGAQATHLRILQAILLNILEEEPHLFSIETWSAFAVRRG